MLVAGDADSDEDEFEWVTDSDEEDPEFECDSCGRVIEETADRFHCKTCGDYDLVRPFGVRVAKVMTLRSFLRAQQTFNLPTGDRRRITT